jgi:iron complex transport system substrate-binding protein
MKIASLVPSATEMLFALGLGDDVAGVTHECDHPPAAAERAVLTRTVIPAGLGPAEVDAAVRERLAEGEALYELDAERLAGLGVGLIATQQICEVCAVSYEDVRTIAGRLPAEPEVISLDPSLLGEVFDDAERLATAAGQPERGERLRAELHGRVEAVRRLVAGAPRPRVAALEWLEPVFAAGHWVPEMIAAAGGEDVLATPGARSREIGWEEVAAAAPDVIVVMPCGLDCTEALAEAGRMAAPLAAAGTERVFAVDAAASFSRPGPRLAEGIELLAHLLHPELAPKAPLPSAPFAPA